MENVQMSLIAVVALLAANAFFVAAEFALVKVRGFQLDQAAADGSGSAVLSARMHRHMDAYLAACQLGITMASLGLGWVGEPAVAALLEPLFSRLGVSGPALHTTAFVVGFLIFSSLHIVIGEQVPKTYAIRRPQPVTLALAYPLHWFYLLVFPLNWLLDRANAGILKLLGVGGRLHHDVITEDEISTIIDTSQAHGEIEEKTADIIRKAFRFDDQTVREIMVPWVDVDTLQLSADASRNESIVLGTQHSRFPVLDDVGDVAGVLVTKDLTTALLRQKTDFWTNLGENLRNPLVVPGGLLISSLLERMRSTRVHMAVVVNEHGTYVGIVTLEDMLEEIVGEIDDEWDLEPGVAAIEAVDSGWRVSGQLTLPDLQLAIACELQDAGRVTTVGGLIMERLGRVPREGDCIEECDLEFRVSKMAGRRVHTVLISASHDRPA